MKYLVFLALLLISQNPNNAQFVDNTIEATSTGQIDDVKLSPRLLVRPSQSTLQPIKGTENPVLLARQLLRDLKLYNLLGEVVQAKHVKDVFGNGLLFEMGNALQASVVIKAWDDPTGELIEQLQVNQDTRGFFDAQVEFRNNK